MVFPQISGPLILRAIVPACSPGLAALNTVAPEGAAAGTVNCTRLPVADRMVAATPPTVTVTLVAPKPMPVRVMRSPATAQDGVILVMRTSAWAISERPSRRRARRTRREHMLRKSGFPEGAMPCRLPCGLRAWLSGVLIFVL